RRDGRRAGRLHARGARRPYPLRAREMARGGEDRGRPHRVGKDERRETKGRQTPDAKRPTSLVYRLPSVSESEELLRILHQDPPPLRIVRPVGEEVEELDRADLVGKGEVGIVASPDEIGRAH